MDEEQHSTHETSGLMMRILGPVTTFVNKPWKMYPVGVLFGFGFDTASSVALLAVTALARKGTDGQSIARGDIVILPFLFTAGMSLVDSADSVLMLYSYAGFAEQNRWALVKRKSCRTTPQPSTPPRLPKDDSITRPVCVSNNEKVNNAGEDGTVSEISPLDHTSSPGQAAASGMEVGQNGCTDNSIKAFSENANPSATPMPDAVELELATRVKFNTMSNLSIVLTLISILVALSISLITILGLIGEQCGPCLRAANAEDGGGLAGSWWRGWAKANDASGFIGAAIVGGFVLAVAGWYVATWAARRWNSMKAMQLP